MFFCQRGEKKLKWWSTIKSCDGVMIDSFLMREKSQTNKKKNIERRDSSYILLCNTVLLLSLLFLVFRRDIVCAERKLNNFYMIDKIERSWLKNIHFQFYSLGVFTVSVVLLANISASYYLLLVTKTSFVFHLINNSYHLIWSRRAELLGSFVNASHHTRYQKPQKPF